MLPSTAFLRYASLTSTNAQFTASGNTLLREWHIVLHSQSNAVANIKG